MAIRTVIVDDEVLARRKIKAFLREHPTFQVVGECSTGSQAASAIVDLKPDLLFLDVQIPERDGFQVLESLDSTQIPIVIFVTAYDRYAVKAFEVHALDYLLKPFNRKRFAEALARVKARIQKSKGAEKRVRLFEWLRETTALPQHSNRLAIKSGKRILLLPVARIEWIEAEGDYIRLHLGKESHFVRDTMHSIEARLDPNRFVRIHRSAIVNLDFVSELYPLWGGDYRVLLRGGTEVTLSRAYRHKIQSGLPKTAREEDPGSEK